MKKLITTEQELEIVELAKDHKDAIIAFGADMYRDGLIKGAIVTCIGVLTGMAVTAFVYVRKELKKKKDNHE